MHARRAHCMWKVGTFVEFPYFIMGISWNLNLKVQKEQEPCFILNMACISEFNPLNPAGRFSGLHKQGPRNPAGRFSGICYGVSKTRRAFKPAHVRLIIKWFVYTGRYQATLRSQVESSSLFSFRTICNLLTGFCTRYTNLRRKYGGDTQYMWRYRYSLHVMANVEELYNKKNRTLRQKRRNTWYLLVSNKYVSR